VKKIVQALACSLVLSLWVVMAYASEEKWPGVDDTVVGKYAQEHGRPAKPNLIELEGDALLFAFLIAGAVGGFTFGYYYRDFMSKKSGGREADAL
jgi:cobalt/nickel transport protein